jgi:hypothetical protein
MSVTTYISSRSKIQNSTQNYYAYYSALSLQFKRLFTYDGFFYHCSSLSQRSHFFVRPCVLSGGATYPNTSIMSLSSISLMEMESFLSTCIFSYSARQDVQMPIFWPPPHKRPKMDYKHYIRTYHKTITTA